MTDDKDDEVYRRANAAKTRPRVPPTAPTRAPVGAARPCEAKDEADPEVDAVADPEELATTFGPVAVAEKLDGFPVDEATGDAVPVVMIKLAMQLFLQVV